MAIQNKNDGLPPSDPPGGRRRSKSVLVMLNPSEHDELRIAAEQKGLALSVFMRVVALEAARRSAAQSGSSPPR